MASHFNICQIRLAIAGDTAPKQGHTKVETL